MKIVLKPASDARLSSLSAKFETKAKHAIIRMLCTACNRQLVCMKASNTRVRRWVSGQLSTSELCGGWRGAKGYRRYCN